MRRTVVLLAMAVALVAAGCRDDRITIAYQPRPGAVFSYSVHVSSTTTTALADRPVSHQPLTSADFTATHRVLDAKDGITRVEVRLAREGIGERTFVMRFDRAAQLTAVESVEGIPAEALGSLGLSELFPAAAGAPPDRPLRPGDRWTIDDHVQLAGMDAPAQLVGTGRLVELGIVDGHDAATVTSSTSLPLTSTTATSQGVQTLIGTQTTAITVVYDLRDGSVRHSTATTSGQFTLILGPPAGQPGTQIKGTLTVELTSEIRRI